WGGVGRLIDRERTNAMLPTVSGQTTLKCAMKLHEHGILDKFKVEMIGARPAAIAKAEDRQQFKLAMQKIGIAVPRSGVARSLADALEIYLRVGPICVIRPSFTLGGTGGGIAYKP